MRKIRFAGKSALIVMSLAAFALLQPDIRAWAQSKVTALTNVTGASLVAADEFYVVDQDGDGGSPASRALSLTELRVAVGSTITLGTEASGSGTSIDFTSIPSGIRRITVMFAGLSHDGAAADPVILQLGDSGGIEATGYTGGIANSSSNTSRSTSFGVAGSGSFAAANSIHGEITISLEDSSDDTWTANGSTWNDGGDVIYNIAGSKSLSAELDRVRITTTGGTDAFDAGVVNIQYQ